MKTTIDKCESCQALFEDEAKYTKHVEMHEIITLFEGAFPKVVDNHCDFANGGWTEQRSKNWLNRYTARLIEAIGDIGHSPKSYGWFRCLDDSGHMLYDHACRILRVCPKCYREWGQQYDANRCNCQDKVRTKLERKD